MADRPINMEAVSKCREKLRGIGGDELVLEASVVVGAFALFTKVVDATGRKEDPFVLKIIHTVFFVMKYKATFKYGFAAIFAFLWCKAS